MTASLPLINLLTPLAESDLVPVGLFRREFLGPEQHLCFQMNKNKWNHKKIKSLKDVGLLIKGVSETVENEGKKQKRGMLN